MNLAGTGLLGKAGHNYTTVESCRSSFTCLGLRISQGVTGIHVGGGSDVEVAAFCSSSLEGMRNMSTWNRHNAEAPARF